MMVDGKRRGFVVELGLELELELDYAEMKRNQSRYRYESGLKNLVVEIPCAGTRMNDPVQKGCWPRAGARTRKTIQPQQNQLESHYYSRV